MRGRKPARDSKPGAYEGTNVRVYRARIELPLDDAVFLNSVYRGQYPTEEGLLPYGQPTEADARKALSIAESVVSHVKDARGKLANQIALHCEITIRNYPCLNPKISPPRPPVCVRNAQAGKESPTLIKPEKPSD